MKGEQQMQQQQQQYTPQSPQQTYQPHQQQKQHQHDNSPTNSLVSHGGGGIIAGTGRDFFSSFSNEITGITSSTSSMFSGLFGKSNNYFYSMKFLLKCFLYPN